MLGVSNGLYLPGLHGVSGSGVLSHIDAGAGTAELAAGRSMLTDNGKLLESLRIIIYHPT